MRTKVLCFVALLLYAFQAIVSQTPTAPKAQVPTSAWVTMYTANHYHEVYTRVSAADAAAFAPLYREHVLAMSLSTLCSSAQESGRALEELLRQNPNLNYSGQRYLFLPNCSDFNRDNPAYIKAYARLRAKYHVGPEAWFVAGRRAFDTVVLDDDGAVVNNNKTFKR